MQLGITVLHRKNHARLAVAELGVLKLRSSVTLVQIVNQGHMLLNGAQLIHLGYVLSVQQDIIVLD